MDQPSATLAEHPNAKVMRRVLDAFNAGDMEALDRLIADDIVWHEIGRAEPRRGKDEMRSAMAEGQADYTITTTVHDVVASDDHVIALVDATATRNGRTFKYRTAEICHIRNGQIAERWAFSDDTAAIVAFFA